MNKNYFVLRFKIIIIYIYVYFEYFILKNLLYIKLNINIIRILNRNDL